MCCFFHILPSYFHFDYSFLSPLLQPQVQEDDPTYSSPADIGIASPTRGSYKRQMCAGSDKRRSAYVLDSTSTPTPPPTSGDEYAVIPSANTIGKLDTLKRSQQNSFESQPPSGPAPPPPDSPPIIDPEMIYASVDTPPQERRAIPRQGYDHLNPSPDDRPPLPPPAPPSCSTNPNNYDHLTPRTRRRMEAKGLLPVEQMSPDEEEELYAIPDKSSGHKPAFKPWVGPKPIVGSKPVVGPKPTVGPKPGYMAKPPVRPQHFAAPTDPEALYALPEKTMPPRKLQLRSIEHTAPDSCPDNLYAIPDRQSKVRNHLPPDSRSRKQSIEHTAPDTCPDNLYAIPDRLSKTRSPSPPDSHDWSTDDKLDDEAPPLPARHYSWSDIEDSDDDDDDDDSITDSLENGPLAEYATVAEATASAMAAKPGPPEVPLSFSLSFSPSIIHLSVL